MNKENWATCINSEGRKGNIAVDVYPSCPNSHLIKGRLVSTTRICRECKDYKGREEN